MPLTIDRPRVEYRMDCNADRLRAAADIARRWIKAFNDANLEALLQAVQGGAGS